MHKTAVCICLLCAMLSACATQPDTRFYLLTAVESEPAQVDSGFTVVVEPPELPEYLDRPQLVLRHEAQQIQLLEFDRWAEPLRESMPRVLAEDLTARLAKQGGKALVRPPRLMPVDYWLHLNVERFDFYPGRVELRVHWLLTSGAGAVKDGYLRAERDFAVAGDYNAAVAASSALIEQLAEEISKHSGALKAGAGKAAGPY